MAEPASATRPAAARPGEPPEFLLVLGCPSGRHGWPSAVQRWRVDLAAAVAGPETTWVFSGYRGEAGTMAADARRRHDVPPGRIVLEPAAATTWENVAFGAALIPPGSRVGIVSDPGHAARAVAYWRMQFPERADEARALGSFDWHHPLLTAVCAVYEGVLRLGRGRAQPPVKKRATRSASAAR